MKSSITTLAVAFCLLSPRLNAEDAPSKPSPEIKKFEMFVGKWKLDEVDETSPFSLAGKATFNTETRFVHNGFFVEDRGRGLLNGKPMSYTIVYRYDVSAHMYRSFYYDSTGAALSSEGAFEGNTWSTHWAQEVNGKNYKGKSVTVFSPDAKKFTYEWTYSEDGVTWKPMFKGTPTKVGLVKNE